MRFKRCMLPVISVLAIVMLAQSAGGATATTKSKAKSTKASKVTTTTKAATTTAAPTTSTTAATTTTTTAPVTGTINVSAAQSLTASFSDIAKAFEKANPEAKVVLNFAGSATLVTQIRNGAPADIFASADTANMDKLVDAKLIDGTPQIFTRNKLMIVTPRGNPQAVKSLADLSREEVFVGLGAVGVPVGDYARQILAKAGVTVKPKTLESNVTAIVNKVALREIDAGMVYVTDVALDEYRVDGITIPDDLNVTATYPIATLSASKQKVAANAVVAFTRSAAGQAILKKYKFLPLP
jgi:molybdate transport system substrate-binding protein